MNIALYMTLARLVISPLFILVYVEREALMIDWNLLPYLLLLLFVISELTDLLDGYVARKYNLVTDLGKILDPMADSIYRIAIFLTFTLPPIQLPIFLVFVFIYRDLLIGGLRTVCALKGFALAARSSGKIKAILQASVAFVLICLLIPYSQGKITQEQLRWIGSSLVGLTALYSFLSGVEYVYYNRHYITKIIEV